MRAGLMVVAVLLAGCSLVPRYTRPEVALPQAWQGAAVSGTEIPADWWTLFEDAQLNGLVARALADNTDIAAAGQRVRQARAALTAARSYFWPSVDASGSAGRGLGGGNNDTSLGAGASVSYEADLFGANRANAAGARESYAASRYDKAATDLVVASDVANTYFGLLSLRERVASATRNLEFAQGILEATQARFDAGAISGLELAQQKTAVAGTTASLAQLRQQEAASGHALAVLLGMAGDVNVSGTTVASVTVPRVAAGLPAELLTRRPDVQRTEAQLRAANADVGVARAALLPGATLGADLTASFDPTEVTARTVAGLVAPIFHGGRLMAGVEISQARKAELIASYKKTVLTAWQEAADALTAVESAAARLAQLQASADNAATAAEIARQRYAAGLTDFTTLLSAQQTLLQADDSLVQARLERLDATLQLIKALGGGWRPNS